MQTGTLAAPPEKNPIRESFRFDGWTRDGQPFDFQTPILEDTTLKAKWTKTTDWTLSPDHGPVTGAQLTISPPNPQEPYYTSIQSAGNQIVGLTGDGRIYVWTQDSTPKQVPLPAQAPDGFHYLQTTAGSHWQAAIGSDQHIYIWTNRQATPTILDSDRNAGFGSISMNGRRLLAVDRQGQVHVFQTGLTGSQSLNSKPTKQSTLSLPREEQAVSAVVSASRILTLDSNGQAWAWNAANTESAKPERIKQKQDMRIIQAQALNQGFLLLDTGGQAYYLADGKSSPTTVSLPGGEQIGRINRSNGQTMIVDKDGCLWTWEPGKVPMHADNRKLPYMQAAKAGSRITAISRQGSMFAWSLDGQGQPGKPARLETATAPILESASMDGQPLKLTRNNGSWQADMPARKPGEAVILITGRQDGRPFTRSLTYTVDRPLTRAAEPRSTLTVRFDTGGGSPVPADQSFSTINGRVKRPSPDPSREGFLFDGWFIGQVAYDFSKPVTKDLTLTAKWTPASRNNTWSISPDKGSQLGNEAATITPPDSASRGIRFSQISGGKEYNDGSFSLAVGSDGNAYAWGYNGNGQLGDGTNTTRSTPVRVKTPDRNTYPDLPKDFTYVQVSAGGSHSLALGSDGNAYAWGSNSNGQLGDGTTTSYRNAPVRVKTPNRNTYPDLPADFTYLQVSAGTYHSLAVGSDGNVYAWGDNGNGQLGDGTTTSYRNAPVRVKTPDRKTYPDLPADFTYVQISAGGSHSLALGSDGNAYAWGSNSNGQLGDGTTTRRTTPVRVRKPAGAPTDFSYVQVSAGYRFSLAVDSDRYACTWGSNSDYQLGNNSRNDSTVPVHVRDPTGANKRLKVVQVSARGDHSLAVDSDGYAWTWGCNSYGQLGNNSSSYHSPVPVHVRDPANPTDTNKGLKAVQVSAGYHHSLAVGSDGYTYAWGRNSYGQLGNDSIPTGEYNSNARSNVPVPVVFNLALVITGVRFDQTAVSGLTRGDGNSVTVFTPAHQPGTVTVSVDYTLGGAPQTPDTSLRYTYLPAGVLPQAGGEGILLALATGMTGMGGVLASRRHRKEAHQLSHASHE